MKELRSALCILQKQNIIVVCQVDDKIMLTQSHADIHELCNQIERVFKITDLGKHTQCLEVDLRWGENSLQFQPYQANINQLTTNKMEVCKPVESPRHRNIEVEEMQKGEALSM